MKPQTNYSYEQQLQFLEMFLSDADSFARCQNIFNPSNFDQRLRSAAEFIDNFVDQYKIMPDVKIIESSTGLCLETKTYPSEMYDWLIDTFERFARHKALEQAILKSAELLQTGEYNPVEKLIKDAIQISLNRDMGTDYFQDPRARLELLKNSNGQVSTGWPSVDKKLYGGFNRGELNIFAAASGGGKSLFLANLGVNWAMMGLNVVYLTFELSENLVAMRLDSMTTGISTREIFRSLDDVELKVKMLEKRSGSIQIKYMPSGKNCNDLRSYLKEYQVKKGRKPDVLLIDYLDLMMPLSVKVSPSDLFVKDKYVSEEIRNLAMETQCLTVTASQLNRAAVEEIEFDHSHISGGLSKIQTADNVIGIFTSRAMKERGRYQIQFMKTRSSSGVGQKVDLEFNVETLRITDLNEEDQDSLPQQRSSTTNMLRRTSVVSTASTADPDSGEMLRVANPKEGSSATKLKLPQKTAPAIRNMLSHLNPERD